jgi:transaldolase / glucose-6-phosphate isomerase
METIMTSALVQRMTNNPLKELLGYGQSVWLDYLSRGLISSGSLARLIEEDGLHGVTSNPAIFEKAIGGSADYRDLLDAPQYRDYDAKALYEEIAVRDVRDAADILWPVYESTDARDGYVSLEVSPALAHDTEGTLNEARRLWRAVDRQNLMIKVPATAEGIPAIRQLISEAINVNSTLLFAPSAYEEVAEAFLAGLEDRQVRGLDVGNIASVASFFISRIDTAVDGLLTAKIQTTTDASERRRLTKLLGRAAIANARITYQRARELYNSRRMQQLAARGAQLQRLLWASTSTKNPAYRDLIYVEELIGSATVNTMPPATLDAFRDHGHPRRSLTENLETSWATMLELRRAGISMKEVADKLLEDGIQQFETAFSQLLRAIDRHAEPHSPLKTKGQTIHLC